MVLVGSPSCGKTSPLQQAVAPLLKLDGEYDMIYCKEMETYRRWERMSAKQRERHSLPEEMKMPQRKCHVVVDSTVEALISARLSDALLSNTTRSQSLTETIRVFGWTPISKLSRFKNYIIAKCMLLA